MIKYYESATQIVDGHTRPVANVTVASRTSIAYALVGGQAAIMAEVTQAQHDEIVATGGVEKTRLQLAAIYLFPVAFSTPPWGG